MSEQAAEPDDEFTEAETAELTDEERAFIPDDDDALDDPYTDEFDGVQDPEGDPELVDKVETIDAAADERREEGDDDA